MEFEPTLYLSTQIGDVSLAFDGKKLLSLSINSINKNLVKTSSSIVLDSHMQTMRDTIELQLNKYFSSAISFDDIQLAPQGTKFQKSVWTELTKIPIGETRTYGQIAENLNSSARAVGNACRRNPIQIIIPCHRVVSAKGLGGYAGETGGEQLAIKKWLLSHEGYSFE